MLMLASLHADDRTGQYRPQRCLWHTFTHQQSTGWCATAVDLPLNCCRLTFPVGIRVASSGWAMLQLLTKKSASVLGPTCKPAVVHCKVLVDRKDVTKSCSFPVIPLSTVEGRRPSNKLAMPWEDQQNHTQALPEADQHPGAAANPRSQWCSWASAIL